MKNILQIPIIFAFIFSACSDFSGNEDAVEASLKPNTSTTTSSSGTSDDTTSRTYYDLDGV